MVIPVHTYMVIFHVYIYKQVEAQCKRRSCFPQIPHLC